MRQENVFRMIRRRAAKAGVKTAIGCHSFRALGITTYLENGGTLEKAQQLAAAQPNERVLAVESAVLSGRLSLPAH